jgi:butyrate kinase
MKRLIAVLLLMLAPVAYGAPIDDTVAPAGSNPSLRKAVAVQGIDGGKPLVVSGTVSSGPVTLAGPVTAAQGTKAANTGAWPVKHTNSAGDSVQDVTVGNAHIAIYDDDGNAVDVTPDGAIVAVLGSPLGGSKSAFLEVTGTGEATILAANVSKSFKILSIVVVNDGFIKAVGTLHRGTTADVSGTEDSNIYAPFSTANDGGIHMPSEISPMFTGLNTAFRINVESTSGSGTLKVTVRYLDD